MAALIGALCNAAPRQPRRCRLLSEGGSESEERAGEVHTAAGRRVRRLGDVNGPQADDKEWFFPVWNP